MGRAGAMAKRNESEAAMGRAGAARRLLRAASGVLVVLAAVGASIVAAPRPAGAATNVSFTITNDLAGATNVTWYVSFTSTYGGNQVYIQAPPSTGWCITAAQYNIFDESRDWAGSPSNVLIYNDNLSTPGELMVANPSGDYIFAGNTVEVTASCVTNR